MQNLKFLSTILLVILATGVAHAQGKAEAIKKDLKAMKGKWTMDKMETDGNANPAADRMGALFDGTQVTMTRDGKATTSFRITIDPTADPKTMDMLWTSGVTRGKTSMAIYRFTEDGSLEICWNQARGKGSDKRPAAFTTKVEVGAGSVLYVFKKEKK